MKRRDAFEHKLDSVSRGINRLMTDARFFSYLRQNIGRKQDEIPSPRWGKYREVLGVFIALGIVVLSAAFFFARLSEFNDWPPAVYHDKEVYNLTAEKVLWDVHYGPSQGCQSDKCYQDPSTPASYFRRHAVLPLREFPIADWKTGDKIYYRARVKLPENIRQLALTRPISIHTIKMFAESWDLYLNQTPVFQGTEETMLAPIPPSYIQTDGFVDISIVATVGALPYQGIANRGDMVIGPREKLANLTFFSRDNSTSLQLLYLLPKLAFCVVFAVLFMFVGRNQEIMWFLLFGLTSSLELFLRSAYADDLGLSGHVTALLALVFRNYSLLLMARFVYAFFRLRLATAEKVMTTAVAALTVFNVFSLLVMDYSHATRALDMIAIIIKPCVYIFSFVLALAMAGLLSTSERSVMRSRIALCFSFVLLIGTGLACVDLVKLVANTMGVQVPLTIVNLTWVFDLVLFVVIASITGIELALQHTQQRQIEFRLRNLNERIELASSVQDTLLPEVMAGQREGVAWDFRYFPAERMAGDWLYMSDTNAPVRRYMIGDVTGKGPAAALAVAAIISVLRTSELEESNLTGVIKLLNSHLCKLFRGRASTALCLAEIGRDGETRVAVHGMLGFIHVKKDGVSLIPARGSTLGARDEIDVKFIELTLDVGDLLICFSDGCLEGTRTMRRLIHHLSGMDRADMTPDKLFNEISEIGKDSVHPDDKVFLVVRRVS